jgi:hypothetical protein
MVMVKLNWLHDSWSFPLNPLHSFIASQAGIRPVLLTIYKWLVVSKKHDDKSNYLLDDNNAETILAKCVTALVEGTEVLILEQYFHEWVKDQRIRKLLAKIVSAMEKEKILKLPKAVQETAYSHICQGDNIYDYGNEVEFIAAMNEQDNATFNKQIEKVILNKLTKEESFNAGLQLLEIIKSFKGMKKANLRSYLDEKSQDSVLGERIAKILERIS